MAATSDPSGAGWTRDRLLGGRLVVRQPPEGYRVAIDTLLLAAAVPARAGETWVELGAGIGAAALALAVRVPGVRVLALERDPVLAAALAANARANRCADAVAAVAADVARPPLGRGIADGAFLNPPYGAGAAGSAPRTALGRRARREGAAGLPAWLAAAAGMVRPGGELVAVHRADRLAEVLAALAPQPVTVLPLWPKAGRAARRMLVRARVGRRGGVRLLAGLVLHDLEGHFTAEAEAVLRGAAAIRWE